MEDEQLEAFQEALLEKDRKRLRESDATRTAQLGVFKRQVIAQIPEMLEGLKKLEDEVLREVRKIKHGRFSSE